MAGEEIELRKDVLGAMNRRSFLSSAGMLLAAQSLNTVLPAQAKKEKARPAGKADHSLRIEPCALEIGPGVTIETRSFNGKVPGPLLSLREGVPVSIDVTNAGTDADIVHWHGLAIDSLNDGAMEEGSPMIPPHRLIGILSRRNRRARAGITRTPGRTAISRPAHIADCSVFC